MRHEISRTQRVIKKHKLVVSHLVRRRTLRLQYIVVMTHSTSHQLSQTQSVIKYPELNESSNYHERNKPSIHALHTTWASLSSGNHQLRESPKHHEPIKWDWEYTGKTYVENILSTTFSTFWHPTYLLRSLRGPVALQQHTATPRCNTPYIPATFAMCRIATTPILIVLNIFSAQEFSTKSLTLQFCAAGMQGLSLCNFVKVSHCAKLHSERRILHIVSHCAIHIVSHCNPHSLSLCST